MSKIPLNLISTPVALLNSLGLNLRVGLSSEDPMVYRHPSETYHVYLSIYSPEGVLLDRKNLGEIPPRRRKFFDVSSITRELVASQDHLAVVHRIPSSLMSKISDVAVEIELSDEPDYSMFRSLVEYSYPQGGNGSVIYETPPRLNTVTNESRSSNTLTFTCQVVLSEAVQSHVVLIHHSVSPSYSRIASYNFALYSLSGEFVAKQRVSVAPFSVKIIDLSEIIPNEIVGRERDPQDGQSAFTLVGYSEDAAFLFLVVNTAPSLKGVAVEHTHPSQSYLLPLDAGYQREVKAKAMAGWRSIITG